MNYTVNDLTVILNKAQQAAVNASEQAYQQNGNSDWDACGFAWVDIYAHDGKKLKGNTKMGKALKQAGIDQNWNRVFSQWCNWYGGQSISIKEAGARAYARVLEGYGFTAYAGSRLD